ncbi:hypothetical protein CARUB_v10003569mg [Capsella rubella]|uniref:F-box domain-containing protein n=1 Tax=Capsella rubella TaxID=81985 RepID=R0H7Z8_9BRAS|nr:hypothetical protein CARUB_v10003569mg [Capsella rubella]
MTAPIDKLPEELLSKIISFLPLKFAISTSVLSKKWENAWKIIPSVCIVYRGDESSAIPITSNMHRLTTEKISTFHLRVDRVPKRDNDVDDCLCFFMMVKPENMVLRFIGSDHEYSFMDEFFDNGSIKRLIVEHPHMKPMPKPVSWCSLRSLALYCPYLPQQALDNILVGCPVMRSLTLHQCEDQLVYFDLREAPSVENLDIDMMYWNHDVSDAAVKIEAPNIRYLRLSIASPCVLVDVSSLKEAKLNISNIRWLTKVEDFLPAMMLKLQNVKKLTFGSTFLDVLSSSLAQVHDFPFPTFKVEDLTLETMILESLLPGIGRLLQNSPALKHLTVDVVKQPEEEADHVPVHSFIHLLRLLNVKTLLYIQCMRLCCNV